MVLADKERVYYYNEDSISYETLMLGTGMTIEELSALSQLSDAEIEAIAEKKEYLLTDLSAAFEQAGISVAVDTASGEMAVDASVLFGGDSSKVTDEGKEFLNKFLSAYTSIVFSEKYEGFVKKTMIEGHTAPLADSTYESGLPLSQERADNVKKYCLSAKTGIDSKYLDMLTETMEAVGYSNSMPIYDNDGNINLEACRRVSFRFIVNLEK